jgi:hypothetical protein
MDTATASEAAKLLDGSTTGIDGASVEASAGSSPIPAAAVAGAATGLYAEQIAMPAAWRSSGAAAAVTSLLSGAGVGADSGGAGVLGTVRGWAASFMPSSAPPLPRFKAAGSPVGGIRAGSVAAALGKDDGAVVSVMEAPCSVTATSGDVVAVDSR